MARRKLTIAFLNGKQIIPHHGQIDWFDTLMTGFGVRASFTGRRSFFIMYYFGGRKVRYTLKPPYPALQLATAREEARRALQAVAGGVDPRAARRKRAVAAAETPTYAAAVEDYIARYQIAEHKNASAKEVRRVLLKEGEPWKRLLVTQITARDIQGRLEAIRDGRNGYAPSPTLANRFFSYLSVFFKWCKRTGIEKVERSPCEGMVRPSDHETPRERHFDDDEIKALWRAADAVGDYQGAFVKLALLTGKRKSALASMRWDEINETHFWTPQGATPVTAGRSKHRNKRLHAIPLSALAVRVISGLHPVEGNPYVFASDRSPTGHIGPGSPLQNSVQAKSGVRDFGFHACRHTVETGMGALRVPAEVRDMVLDHAPQRGAGSGYDHYHYVEVMTEAVEKWADHIKEAVWPEGVVGIHG